MKRGTTLIALTGTALFIALGLLLFVGGISSFVSRSHIEGGIVGWLLDAEPEREILPRVRTTNGDVCDFLSVVLGVLLIPLGLGCALAGLVTGAVGMSRQTTMSRSVQWLLVGAIVVGLTAPALSAAWLTIGRTNRGDAAAATVIRKLGGKVLVTGGARNRRIREVAFDDAGIQITDTDLKELKHLASLRTLNLANKTITDAGLKELTELNSLVDLNLNGTQITDAGLTELKQLKTQVKDPELRELKELKSLRSLSLNGTRVTNAGLTVLLGLKSLQTLNLANTSVTDAGLNQLKNIESLEYLNLDGTQVTDAGLKELKEFKSLRGLGLQNTRVTDAGLKELAELESLKGYLNIGGSQVTRAGVEELKSARPGLGIFGKVR